MDEKISITLALSFRFALFDVLRHPLQDHHAGG
jgi:hypothetical protein